MKNIADSVSSISSSLGVNDDLAQKCQQTIIIQPFNANVKKGRTYFKNLTVFTLQDF